MGTLLGKRKSRASEKESEVAAEDAEAIFRRHFEAQFKPLATTAAPRKLKEVAQEAGPENGEEGSDADSVDSEWGGISEDENDDTNTVEVVDHTSSNSSNTALSTMTKRELRAYLSSRPPSSALPDDDSLSAAKANKKSKSKDGAADSEDEDSATLLANDLALQRLIAESKILSSAAASPSADRAFAEGRTRRITTDMRLQALGSRESVLAQKKMPMSMRKGITGAAAAREDRRRREAKENGIILEKAVGGKKKGPSGKRRRGGAGGGLAVDMPGVGRMKGAELRLSQKDIRSMEGPREKAGGKKRRRR